MSIFDIYEIIYLLFVSAWNSVSYRVTKKNNKISMLKVKHRKNSVMRYISDVYKNKVNSFVYILFLSRIVLRALLIFAMYAND